MNLQLHYRKNKNYPKVNFTQPVALSGQMIFQFCETCQISTVFLYNIHISLAIRALLYETDDAIGLNTDLTLPPLSTGHW